MRLVVLGLLLGISFAAVAEVAPLTVESLPKVGVRQTNRSNMKIMRKEKEDENDNKLGEEATNRIRRYQNIVKQENVQAVANMSRLMQNDPDQFMRQVYLGGNQEAKLPEISLVSAGTEDELKSYEMPMMGNDPVKNLANVPVPELTGSVVELTGGKEEFHRQYVKARKQIEQIGRQHLGQKVVPIRLK